jgi:hypothetical protein
MYVLVGREHRRHRHHRLADDVPAHFGKTAHPVRVRLREIIRTANGVPNWKNRRWGRCRRVIVNPGPDSP